MKGPLSTSNRAEESLCSAQGSQPLGAYTKEQYLRNCSRFDSVWQQAIAHQANTTSTADIDIAPRFQPNQQVHFVGGCGTVKACLPYAQTWTYAVEMELGPEPEMGRIGSEATILLSESEIQAQ